MVEYSRSEWLVGMTLMCMAFYTGTQLGHWIFAAQGAQHKTLKDAAEDLYAFYR